MNNPAMKRFGTIAGIALVTAMAAAPLAGCAEGYGYGGGVAYGAGPYTYDGYYDGAYGPVYDGYWGDDDYFYYRSGPNDTHFHRGDHNHFAHDAPAGGGPGRGNFQQMHGQFNPGAGMRAPHFGRGRHGH